ncbi:MAG: hypothetical protein ABEJ70_05165 [Halobacteriaceae archaeon]
MAEPSVALFGPLDTVVGGYAGYVVFALAVFNMLTRKMAHDAHKRQVREGGEDALSRHPLHVVTTWGLVLAAFYYLTLHHHSGIVLSVLVLGVFVTDVFEFEARRVEAREDLPVEQPKGAMLASVVVFLYAAYVSVFFVVEPVWSAIV